MASGRPLIPSGQPIFATVCTLPNHKTSPGFSPGAVRRKTTGFMLTWSRLENSAVETSARAQEREVSSTASWDLLSPRMGRKQCRRGHGEAVSLPAGSAWAAAGSITP